MSLNRNIGAKLTMKERVKWISVFFRKNLFTICSLVGFLFILFFIINPFHSKQSSNENSLQTLKKENNQLNQEINNLNRKQVTEKSFYTDKINQLNRVSTALDEVSAEYQQLIEYLQNEIKDDFYSIGIFSPEHTKKGDKIAGLIVSDISYASTNEAKEYHVNFTGEFKVKCSIIHNGEEGYVFIVEENVEKLPRTLRVSNKVYFKIKNENELIKVLGEKLQKMSESDELEIEGVFKNYSYNYVSESENDWNSAEFVRLISQN